MTAIDRNYTKKNDDINNQSHYTYNSEKFQQWHIILGVFVYDGRFNLFEILYDEWNQKGEENNEINTTEMLARLNSYTKQ